MKRAKSPSAIMRALLCIYVPNMITLRLGLFTILVEARDIRLVPQVVADLHEIKVQSGYHQMIDLMS
jgi:uncharacterized membrane protein YvlD (DUF360 family)